MNKKIAGILLLSLPMGIYAQFSEPAGYNNQNNQNNQEVSLLYPVDSSPDVSRMPPKLQQNRFEMNIDQEEVENAHVKSERFKKLLDGTYGVSIMQKADFRPLRAVDNVDLLTNYTTVIIFPENYTIQKSVPSCVLKENRVSRNILFLQGQKSFTEGNTVVSLSDGRKNLVVTLILDKFVKSNNRKNNIFYSYINYVDIPKISQFELLKIYFKLYGKERINFFKKHDGAYDIIEYKNIPFFISRDDRFGTIEYKGVNFKITNGK